MLRRSLSHNCAAHQVLRTETTKQLWSLRQQLVADNKKRHATNNIADLEPRTCASTQMNLSIPLGDDESLRAHYMNPTANQIRVGKLLEDLDSMACSVAWLAAAAPRSTTTTRLESLSSSSQSSSESSPLGLNLVRNIVTARTDRIDMLGDSLCGIPLDSNLELSGRAIFASKSSLTVRVSLLNQGSRKPLLNSDFVLVTVDATGKPTPTNPLVCETAEDWRVFAAAEAMHETIREERKSRKLSSSELAHDIKFLNQFGEHAFAAAAVSSEGARSGGIRTTVPMSSTKRVATHLTQPQDANTSGKLFGGVIMCRAFEIAWVCALTMPGDSYGVFGKKPQLVCCDDIIFEKPVALGSVVIYTAHVSYTLSPLVCVTVVCEVVDPSVGGTEAAKSKTVSNSFEFIFAPDSDLRADQAVSQITVEHDVRELVRYARGKKLVDEAFALGKAEPAMRINRYRRQ